MWKSINKSEYFIDPAENDSKKRSHNPNDFITINHDKTFEHKAPPFRLKKKKKAVLLL